MIKREQKYIAYYRVSTQKQGVSGLGMDAQRSSVQLHIGGKPLAEYSDLESGKDDNRPGLLAAIEHCKMVGGILVIAKLDRLSRSVSFISTMMNSGLNFIAVDMPDATPFTLHIFSALAQQERELISQRTKAALKALKDRGKKLGTPDNLTIEAIEKGRETMRENARQAAANKKAAALIFALKKQQLSNAEICRRLNESGYRTRRGSKFTDVQVARLQKMFA
jgi:DNA invertase Pin-like site-specific DNA recombinase